MRPDDSSLPFVSVIVPVYDATPLETCLAHLAAQDYPAAGFEVIVVDNNSPQDVPGIASGLAQARVVREEAPGSYRARNTGIRAARGSIFAFVDADCRPDPGWLAEGVACLRQQDARTVVGGLVRMVWEGEAPNLYEHYDSLVAFKQQAFIYGLNFCVTANLVAYASAFEEVGMFDANLRSGGDREWGQRATDAGYAVRFCPAASMAHPARATFRQLVAKQLRLAGGHWTYHGGRLGVLLKAPWRELQDLLYFIWLAGRDRSARRRIVPLAGVRVALSFFRLLEYAKLAAGATPRR